MRVQFSVLQSCPSSFSGSISRELIVSRHLRVGKDFDVSPTCPPYVYSTVNAFTTDLTFRGIFVLHVSLNFLCLSLCTKRSVKRRLRTEEDGCKRVFPQTSSLSVEDYRDTRSGSQSVKFSLFLHVMHSGQKFFDY